MGPGGGGDWGWGWGGAENMSSSGRSHIGSLFSNEEKKRLVVTLILLPHNSGLVRDVTDAGCRHKMAVVFRDF